MDQVPTAPASPDLVSNLANLNSSMTLSNDIGRRNLSNAQSSPQGSSRRNQFLSAAAFHLQSAYDDAKNIKRHNITMPGTMLNKPDTPDAVMN